MRGWPGVVTPWHLNSQTVSLLIPLENDIGGRHSCVTICFLVIVPPVQVAAEWRQSKTWSREVCKSRIREWIWMETIQIVTCRFVEIRAFSLNSVFLNCRFFMFNSMSSLAGKGWQFDTWHAWHFILSFMMELWGRLGGSYWRAKTEGERMEGVQKKSGVKAVSRRSYYQTCFICLEQYEQDRRG